MNTVLTIAGSDCSGGAGIQADLKTMSALGVYGMSVITAITAQNTMGVKKVCPVSADMVKEQLESVLEDIFPDAVKIGMLAGTEIVRTVADILKKYSVHPVVLDPVFMSTSGHRLLADSAYNTLVEYLIPCVDIITPNIPEAEELSRIEINGRDDMLKAAERISVWYPGAILIKGGHLKCQNTVNASDNIAADLLYYNGNAVWYETEFINNPNTHGTGCTLSSAIASGLAAGKPLETAVRDAKNYLTKAIAAGLNIGKGRGPLNHQVLAD